MNNLISRQAAIKETWKEPSYSDPLNVLTEIRERIKALPSVQPKHGHWIESHEHIYLENTIKEWTAWYCSECDSPNNWPSDFCPYCGVDMRGE